VREGDTLWDIAQKYNVTLKKYEAGIPSMAEIESTFRPVETQGGRDQIFNSKLIISPLVNPMA
jgi:hypothetical protein